jgi:uncharacterized repeat protein (TIGR03803 family)
MRENKLWFRMSGILAVLTMALMLPAGAGAASKYKVLSRFVGSNGANPYAGVIFDAAGNLYGTTYGGGIHGGGTVFKLKPNSDGSWTESVLHSFCSLKGCADGQSLFAGLIFDAAGNLYGTTLYGGDFTNCGAGCGMVFKLKPNSDGSWTKSVLYTFTGSPDGAYAGGLLIFDAAGNLYGTTDAGGIHGGGTVFKLKPNSDGSWTESVLYSFCSVKNCADGGIPFGGLIFDAGGNLYGTTTGGGDVTCNSGNGCGTVFELTQNLDGSWTESVLHSFTGGADGAGPEFGSLIFDAAGNLYGTTAEGGGSTNCSGYVGGCGTVFKLRPNSDGSWTESVLHRFTNHPAAAPAAGLIFDAVGNLYGTTVGGGSFGGKCGDRGCGVVFELTPNSNGTWNYSVLQIFFGKPARLPLDSLVLDKAGNLYGTTYACGGGEYCQGVVFEVTP